MRYLDQRIKGICNELEKNITKQIVNIDQWLYKEGNYIFTEDADVSEVPWQVFDSSKMHWYGKDRHYWFKSEWIVPTNFEGKSLWLNIRTQLDECEDAKNPQFLLFINGQVVQGIDMNHKEVLLFDHAKAGEAITIELQAYSGTLHSEFNLLVDAIEIDQQIKKMFYDLSVPLSAFDRMAEDSADKRDIERILNETINILDLRSMYSDSFYQSLQEALDYVEVALYQELAGFDNVIATCIGHTHIDVAWWWTVAQTREKVGRSFATVLKLMDEFPDYKFMSSQPQLYEFLKDRYPSLYEKIKEKIDEGRWEAEGGMWVEADCNLTSGESLVRQFMYGKKFFKEEFGVDNKILWLPDVFGYSGALPQIMKKSGIDYFMTTKLAWNQFNKIPNDTMMWRGIDGTEIFTHMVTTLGIGQSSENFFTTYNGMLHPDAIMGGWERYQNKEINNDILVTYGYGDGGGGPTREMLETSSRMDKGIKGIPKVRQAFSLEYFEELEAKVKDNKRLEVWEGEFYFEYHRGTYTSMARNKRSNRKSELGLMDLELISVLAEKDITYPRNLIDSLWKTVMINQFHDILPGTSIKEVYDVTKEEYQEVASAIDQASTERLNHLAGRGDGVTVFNTIGYNRSDVVNLGDCNASMLKDENGKSYPVQQTLDGALVYLPDMPSKGYKTYELISETTPLSAFELVSDLELITPYYHVNFDKQGSITGLFDIENHRQVIKKNEKANLFRMYEDKPIYYDNWDIDIYYTEKIWDVTRVSKMEWTEIGSVCATLEVSWEVSNSLISQKIKFYANSRRIDFETFVDWKEHQHLLKVHFPVDIHTDEATFDIQFGNVTRKIHQNTSWDIARFESCGQKWVDLSEGHYGVSLLNDCKYGHSFKDGNMALTLIKSGIQPNLTTDQEEHIFTYALYPHNESWRHSDTVEEAYKLNQPTFTVLTGKVGESYSLVSVDAKNIVIETVKKAEDGNGYIVRMYESENAFTRAELSWAEVLGQVNECDLMENNLEKLNVEGQTIALEFKPYEIKTIRIHS